MSWLLGKQFLKNKYICSGFPLKRIYCQSEFRKSLARWHELVAISDYMSVNEKTVIFGGGSGISQGAQTPGVSNLFENLCLKKPEVAKNIGRHHPQRPLNPTIVYINYYGVFTLESDFSFWRVLNIRRHKC